MDIGLIGTATVSAEIGDLRRKLGLVPSERSIGETVRRLGITKAGNGRAAAR